MTRRAATMTAPAYQASASEAEMLNGITDAVGNRGIVYHINDSRRTPEMESFPDTVIILPDRQTVVFAELKSIRRRTTAGQAVVMAMLAECSRAESWIVRSVPRDGEVGYDQLIDWIGGNHDR